jgi:hypothetical protein
MANASSKRLNGNNTTPLVLVGSHNGVSVIPTPTPLTRLNYFDGKFLRADDLTAEQTYLRRLVELSNQAGGSGVAHGFNVSLGEGDTLDLGPGLAIDPAGRVLLLPTATTLNVQTLIDQSRQLPRLAAKTLAASAAAFADCTVVSGDSPTAVPRGADLYLITIGHAEALCGAEDVYGKLCEEACATSTDRPYRLEGLVVRAVPLTLHTPLATSQAVALTRAHLRSLVASAYYADERVVIGSLISGAGLRADAWCFGAAAATGQDVPIAVLSRAGANTNFLDAWTARLERIETTAKRHWAWRLAMRPWDVYLAQILQFQCQLHDLFRNAPEPGGTDDPCRQERALITEASDTLAEVVKFYSDVSDRLKSMATLNVSSVTPTIQLGSGGLSQLTAVNEKLLAMRKAFTLAPIERVLIRGGIVELPPAGYLPVVPGTVTINKQVRALLGEGVNLRFCVVRPDFVPHALEEAQHMERISLLQGLDAPGNKPDVDILVPNGEIVKTPQAVPGKGFEVTVLATPTALSGLSAGTRDAVNIKSTASFAAKASPLIMSGAGRGEVLASGGAAFHFAGATQAAETQTLFDLARGFAGLGNTADRKHVEILQTAAASAEVQPAPDSVAEIDPAMVAKMVNIAARAMRHQATLRSAEQPFAEAEAVPLEAVRAVRAFAPAQPTESRAVNLWTTMSCDRDPFALTQGEKTPVDLRIVLALPGVRAVVEDFQLRGDFRVDRAAVTIGAERRMTGHFSGVASVRVFGGGIQNAERTAVIDLDAKILRKAPPGEPHTLTLVLGYKKVLEIAINATWSGDPLLAEVTVDYRLLTGFEVGPVTLRLIDARLKANADVLLSANPLHTVSLSAIEVVGAALADTGFAAEATRLLFPPPPPATDELTVRGTLDWVLFHRRRNKQCADLIEQAAPAPTRRYQVYQVEAADLRTAAAIREALLRNNTTVLAKINFRAVGQVAFGGGVPTLLSDPAAVQADWQRVHTGNTILYEAIATRGVGDGDALAIQRVLHLESVLAEITPPEANAVHEVIPKTPDLLSVPGTDGVIVVLTRTVAEKTCQSVYRVNNLDLFKQIIEMVQAGQIATVIGQNMATSLGSVSFNANTAEVVDNSLQPVVTAWGTQGNGPLAMLAVVSKAGDDAAALYDQQAGTIEAALRGTGQPQSVEHVSVSSPVGLPGNCPSIIFIAAQPVMTRTALVVFASLDGNHFPPSASQASQATVTFSNNIPQGEALLSLLKSLTANQPVNGVNLAVLTPPPDAGAPTRVQVVLNTLAAVGRPSTGVKTVVGALTTADRNILLQQGFSLNGIDEVIYLEPNPN